jgi:D-alanyl-lipoteichoic acid acyltransferase DltB (MBOAT superfamily)
MVFSSYEFLIYFLPCAYIGFILSKKLGGWDFAFAFLGAASLAYYANWSFALALILICSVLFNFVVGHILIVRAEEKRPNGPLLLCAVAINLFALGYFKYSDFFIDIVNQVSGSGYSHLHIIMPIGISFYTFIQIGYLVEASSGSAQRQSLSRYIVFATFFPCITAGPLVLQREIFAQMEERKDGAFDAVRLTSGLTMFVMGLFKKVVLADSIAPFADAAFDGVSAGMVIGAPDAWIGSLAYSLQLYFDFSGYSDMAIGLGVIFGIRLPLNFNSPFKACSISDFWRRWHMTMTRFFTTYLFSPMAISGMRSSMNNQHGDVRRYLVASAWPIIFTFLVAGIWHGAGWTFVVYGLIHGFALAINHGWKEFNLPRLPYPVGWLLTMSVVVSGLVVFRAPDLSTATTILAAMWGLSELPQPEMVKAGQVAVDFIPAAGTIIVFAAIVLLAPNTQQILDRFWISTEKRPDENAANEPIFSWRPTLGWSVATAVLLTLAITSIGSESAFLYYKF